MSTQAMRQRIISQVYYEWSQEQIGKFPPNPLYTAADPTQFAEHADLMSSDPKAEKDLFERTQKALAAAFGDTLLASAWDASRHPRVPKGNGILSGRFVDTPLEIFNQNDRLISALGPENHEQIKDMVERIQQFDKRNPEGKRLLAAVADKIRVEVANAGFVSRAKARFEELADTFEQYSQIDWSLEDEATDIGGPISIVDIKIPSTQEVVDATAVSTGHRQAHLDMAAKRLQNWDSILEDDPRTREEVVENWENALVDIQNSPIFTAAQNDAALSILNDGRFLSAAEAGPGLSTFGRYSTQDSPYWQNRTAQEEVLFGAPPATPILYGFVNENFSEKMAGDWDSSYGPVKIELKPELDERATFTLGDSLNSALVPIRKTEAATATANQIAGTNGYPLGRPEELHYVEAQIYGPVTADDIAAIHLPDDDGNVAEVWSLLQTFDWDFDTVKQDQVWDLLQYVDHGDQYVEIMLAAKGMGILVDFYAGAL